MGSTFTVYVAFLQINWHPSNENIIFKLKACINYYFESIPSNIHVVDGAWLLKG